MPDIPTELLLALHLLAIAFFIGGQLYYLFITQPASYEFFTINEQIRFLQSVLKRQNPILLLALCIAVVTGGLMVTPLKGQLGANYFADFGEKLMYKLALFFIVFFISAYQSLSVGFRIRFLDPAAMNKNLEKELNTVRLIMTITSIAAILTTLYVVYVALH